MFKISQKEKGLSQYDIINYIIARDNKAVLATGDQRLKSYSEANGVEIIRTLKIIALMKEKNIISIEEAINACNLLKDNSNTRIPSEDIENLINNFNKDKVNYWVLFTLFINNKRIAISVSLLEM